MISCEGTGKTIEQAIENALFELKASREDVDIKVINEGGFLKKAKVLVTISDDAREKYEKKQEKKKEEKVEQSKSEPKKEEDFSENFMKKKIEKSEKEEKTTEISSKNSEKIEKSEKSQTEAYTKKKKPEEFLKEILTAVGKEAEIERKVDGQYVTYSVNGEDLSELIGHHGECMNALEFIMRLTCSEEEHKKILLDIGGYRVRRAESLTALAQRVADKVAKTGRYHKFEPMPASERKVIHTALQSDDRVTTMSKGEEPQRYLIVFPRNYEE